MALPLHIAKAQKETDFSNVSAVVSLEQKLKGIKEISKQLAKSNQQAVVDAETGGLIEPCTFVGE